MLLASQQRRADHAPAAANAQALGKHGLPAHLKSSILIDFATNGCAEHLRAQQVVVRWPRAPARLRVSRASAAQHTVGINRPACIDYHVWVTCQVDTVLAGIMVIRDQAGRRHVNKIARTCMHSRCPGTAVQCCMVQEHAKQA